MIFLQLCRFRWFILLYGVCKTTNYSHVRFKFKGLTGRPSPSKLQMKIDHYWKDEEPSDYVVIDQVKYLDIFV